MEQLPITHLVVEVPERERDNLTRAQLLRQLTDGVKLIVCCTDSISAERCRIGFQEKAAERVYGVIDLLVPLEKCP